MSGANFTPGPWRVTGANVRADTHEGESALVAVVKDHWYSHTLHPEEKAANARLIAAAPDLLAALESLLETIETAQRLEGTVGEATWEEYRELVRECFPAQIRAAIAKATAKEPKA